MSRELIGKASDFRLSFAGYVEADHLDSRLAEFYRRQRKPGQNVLIDLQDAEYIDVVFLSNLAAFFATRKRLQHPTWIGLPLLSRTETIS